MPTLDPSIDFEFRSGTDIALGLPRYFADPEAAVLCMAYSSDDAGQPGLWKPLYGEAHVGWLLDHVERGGKVRAWNAMFEWHVWNQFCVPLYGWPELRIDQCIDSMAEAAAMNLPQGLDACGSALQLSAELRKDKRGKQLIKLLCIPQEEPKVLPAESYKSKGAHTRAVNAHAKWLAAGGRWINDPELLQELYDYCVQDVVTEMAVSRKLRRLSEYEQSIWVKTQEINLRGVPIARDEIAHVAAIVKQETHRLNTELSELTDGAVPSATSLADLRDWVNDRSPIVNRPEEHVDEETGEVEVRQVAGPLLLDMQGETIEQTLANPAFNLAPAVRRALEIRAAVGQTSTAKLAKMLDVCAPDGTLKNMHVYHGASTGRDASRGGVNLQNLASPPPLDLELVHEVLGSGDYELAHTMYGDQLMSAAVGAVRGMLKAPPGERFVDGDLSSIENRVSAWIADQTDKVELFRQGLDEYKTFATVLFHVEYEEVTPKQRKQSKPGVLGGMFGQGWRGLIDYAAGMGVFLSPEESQHATRTYRAQYHKVQALWYRCGDAAIEAVAQPGVWIKAGSKLQLKCHKGYLWMKLPSGRLIAWAQPRVEMQTVPWDKTQVRPVVTVLQVDSFTKQWRRDKLIGSSIFQSAVQATARDVLMHGMFNVERAGYRVVLRVHDELLALAALGFGSVEHFVSLMCTNPSWCPDLPLAGEGWEGSRFRK